MTDETVRKIDLDNEISVNRLKIFDFWINLFVNSGIPGEKYDKIISNNQVDLFGEVYLPVWVETQTFKEYYTETVFISPEEAKLVAVSDYRARLRELALSCEILKITARHESADDAYKIYCSVFCICDIAEPSPIIVK